MTDPQTSLIIPLQEPPDASIITQIVDFHQRSILHDRVLMRFHPPFTPQKTTQMHQWWTDRLSILPSRESHVFLALAPPSHPLLTSGAASEGKAVGIITLSTPISDTQQSMGDIGMLLIDPDARGKGLAKRMMKAVEDKAKEVGTRTLTLNTTKDCEADLYLYPKLGYTVFGRLPEYGERPPKVDANGVVVAGTAGERPDGVYYYKNLD